MKNNEINIRDPFVLYENGKYYMYGTRANNFGRNTKGFDVYVSEDLENWSNPIECFNSEEYSLNLEVNWAPEVHKYKGSYYMFATFTKQSNNLRGTFILKSKNPLGPFVPHSNGAVTPEDWECLDGTLYINREGKPYIVFCHEHTQIIDGTICFAQLNDELTKRITEPVTLFAASECPWIDKSDGNGHFITDGPFMYRTKTDELLMLWSSFIKGQYAELLVKFDGGEIGTDFTHLEPLIDDDGGHGMIFSGKDKLFLTYHSPNKSGFEKPRFVEIEDNGYTVSVKHLS
ncbi:MAG: family 43 glycosylhydrolase [Clostridia bacterium]|nr:family 43 glycosylhydrolase [Clostridia bacterium]